MTDEYLKQLRDKAGVSYEPSKPTLPAPPKANPELARKLRLLTDSEPLPAHYQPAEVPRILSAARVPPRMLTAQRGRFPHAIPEPWRMPGRELSSVYLCGINGTGKTHGAVVIASEWITHLPRGWQVMFAKAIDIVNAVTDREEWEFESTILHRFSLPHLLILDDIDEVCGKDYSTPKLAYIRQVLDNRLNHLRGTIVTGNRSITEWGNVDTAIQSRLLAFEILEMNGENQWLT